MPVFTLPAAKDDTDPSPPSFAFWRVLGDSRPTVPRDVGASLFPEYVPETPREALPDPRGEIRAPTSTERVWELTKTVLGIPSYGAPRTDYLAAGLNTLLPFAVGVLTPKVVLQGMVQHSPGYLRQFGGRDLHTEVSTLLERINKYIQSVTKQSPNPTALRLRPAQSIPGLSAGDLEHTALLSLLEQLEQGVPPYVADVWPTIRRAMGEAVAQARTPVSIPRQQRELLSLIRRISEEWLTRFGEAIPLERLRDQLQLYRAFHNISPERIAKTMGARPVTLESVPEGILAGAARVAVGPEPPTPAVLKSIQAVLEKLSPRQRQIWDLYREGRTPTQIAQELQTSMDNVLQQLKRVRAKIYDVNPKGVVRTTAHEMTPEERVAEWLRSHRRAPTE